MRTQNRQVAVVVIDHLDGNTKLILAFNILLKKIMDWNYIGFILEALGEILIGVMIIIVHRHVLREHKIDSDVLRQMKREQAIGMFSVALMTIGFFLQVFYRG
jgi:hypothetical protein